MSDEGKSDFYLQLEYFTFCPCYQFSDLLVVDISYALNMLPLPYHTLKNLLLSFPSFIFLSLPLLSVCLGPVDSARPSCFPDGL